MAVDYAEVTKEGDKIDKATQKRWDEVIEYFEHCQPIDRGAWSDIHKDCVDDKRFIQLGEQWASSDQNRVKIVINKLLQNVKQVTNEMRQTNISPRVLPVDNGADIEKAKVRQGVMIALQRKCNASYARQYAAEEAVIGGLGAYRVMTEYVSDKSFDQTISVKRILDVTTVYYGPALEPDFSDAERCTIQEKANAFDKATDEYRWLQTQKEDKAKIWGTGDLPYEYEFWRLEKVPDTLYSLKNGRNVFKSQIKPDAKDDIFVMKDGKRLERETVRRQWYCYKLKCGKVIEEARWCGKWCPIVIVQGREVWVDGKRKFLSLNRFSKDAQKMYNYARGAMAEKLGQAPKSPWLAAIESIPKAMKKFWDRSHIDAVGTLYYNAYETEGKMRQLPMPIRPPAVQVDPAMVQEALMSGDEIKDTTGIHNPSLGKMSNETSGVAINARKLQTNVATYDFQDNLAIATRHECRIINDLIPKVIDTPRQVRMVGEDEAESVIMVNQKAKDEDGNEYEYYLSEEEEYDTAVDVGASYATKRLENNENILELMRVSPVAAQALPNLYAGDLDFNQAQEAKEQIERAMNLTMPGIVAPKKGEDGKEAPMPPQAIKAMQQAEQLQAALSQMAQEMQAMKQDKYIEMAKIQIEQQKVGIMAKAEEREWFQALTERMSVEQGNQLKAQSDLLKAKTDILNTQTKVDADLQKAGLSAALTAHAGNQKAPTEAPDSGTKTEG